MHITYISEAIDINRQTAVVVIQDVNAVSDWQETSGDVEPDVDVAPVAANHSVSESFTPVISSVAAAGKLGSMASEPVGPVSGPCSPSPEGKLPSGGGPGTPGPAGSPPVGVTLRYPSGQEFRSDRVGYPRVC